jgi:hypothetical protein
METVKRGFQVKEASHLPVELTKAVYDTGPKRAFALQHPVYGKISDDP